MKVGEADECAKMRVDIFDCLPSELLSEKPIEVLSSSLEQFFHLFSEDLTDDRTSHTAIF